MNPTPTQIKQARQQAGLTQQAASALRLHQDRSELGRRLAQYARSNVAVV